MELQDLFRVYTRSSLDARRLNIQENPIFFPKNAQRKIDFFKKIYYNAKNTFTMAKEIERQYVVNTEHPEWQKAKESSRKILIIQATIHRGEGNKLRVRLFEDMQTGLKTAYFTFKVNVKSKKSEPKIRDEYEWEVPYRVALYIMIGHKEVKKLRHIYTHTDGKVWDLDEYQAENTGIVLADIELSTIDEKFKLPDFLGQETTKDSRITNNSFSEHPFLNWTETEKAWYEGLKKRK